MHFGTWFLILLTFFESSKKILTKLVTILMISTKLTTTGLLKLKIFQNKGYDVRITDYDATSKILSCDSYYVVNVVMWPKFGNCSIYMREVIITSIL